MNDFMSLRIIFIKHQSFLFCNRFESETFDPTKNYKNVYMFLEG